MSSLRNSVPRRAHKERSQPQARKKFGILEKHKDYCQRAKAYHTKENIIKILKEKDANKNPDEFYYNMIRSKTVDVVHIPESEAKFTQDQLMLMKTQDMGYIKQKWQSEEKKIERLSSMLHSLGDRTPNKHFLVNMFTKEAITKYVALPAEDGIFILKDKVVNPLFEKPTNLFKMLLKYRPGDKAAKKERLLKRAHVESEGKTVEAKKPIVVKYGLNHITYLIEQVHLNLSSLISCYLETVAL
ncbi:hypothetical protein MKW92_027128 [Papaver armeniacum]|nr:hypothetical protein MKW92_027128 [Papaver armeniacum]